MQSQQQEPKAKVKATKLQVAGMHAEAIAYNSQTATFNQNWRTTMWRIALVLAAICCYRAYAAYTEMQASSGDLQAAHKTLFRLESLNTGAALLISSWVRRARPWVSQQFALAAIAVSAEIVLFVASRRQLAALDVPADLKKQAFPASILYMVFCIMSVLNIGSIDARRTQLLRDTEALKQKATATSKADSKKSK